jgi:hypothetical protein
VGSGLRSVLGRRKIMKLEWNKEIRVLGVGFSEQ